MGSSTHLVWIDMEMSGLDPEQDRILEIATLVTDRNLDIVAEGPELVVHQPDSILEAMDDWNRKHHGDSGLTARVRASTTTLEEAEAATLAFIRQHVPRGKCALAGNSVHQDKRFLDRWMPTIPDWLHYRIVDVSTVKELARRWSPAIVERAPRKQNRHRALEDIRESIAELRWYREHFFRLPEA